MSAAQPHKSPRAVVPESFPIDDAFDVDFVDALAQQETYNKHHYRPNSYLHKWWARRCGTTFRAILKHLVTDGEQCAFYASGGLEGKIILDPMMGGGTTVHEAVRLNANVIGADIDPIPILQARAALTEIDIGRLEHAFHTLLDKLQSAMGHHYATHCPDCGDTHAVQFTLYSLCAACDCRNVRLVDSFVLRHNSDDSIVHIDPENGAVMHDGQIIAAGDQLNPLPFVAKKDKRCPRCHVVYRADSSQPFFRRYEPFAVVTHCPHTGLRYLPARHSDRERSAVLDEMRDTLGFDSAEFPLAPGPKSDNLRQHGAASYLDVFSSRQLLFLRHACDIISTFEPAVRLNFALLLSTSLEFNSLLCGYKGALKSRPGAVRHTFTRHAYTIPATALEVNPLYERRTSGTLRTLFRPIGTGQTLGSPTGRTPHRRRFGATVPIQIDRPRSNQLQSLVRGQTAFHAASGQFGRIALA
ncbi:MAG: hypothetical protein M9965_02555 [Anaerolineae bacterium]|nr:hypothetical protein [Anaerolineae bacterium]